MVQLVLYCRKTAKLPLTVLAGAMSTAPELSTISVHFVSDKQQLIHTINALDPTDQIVVAWSFYSPEVSKIRRALHHIRANTKSHTILHLAGGVHATAEPEQSLQLGFDYVAVGEGEQIFVDFMRCIVLNKSPNQVQGIATYTNGTLVRNGRGKTIDLNDYPATAPQFTRFGPIEITRGCVYACRFCQTPYINKARFRHRSVDNILSAVIAMRDNKLRDHRFITPTALSYGAIDTEVNLAAIKELLSAIRNAIGCEGRIFFGSFPSEVRPEHVTEDSLALIKRYADNDNIIIGAQSGSQAVLDYSRRGHDVESVRRAVKLCKEFGFTANVDFLYGLPAETEQDRQQSLTFAQELSDLGAKIHNHSFMPLPGTPFRDSPVEYLDQATQTALKRQAAQGKGYGQWERQMDIAVQLQKLRTSKTN